jgi:hypothetical protein
MPLSELLRTSESDPQWHAALRTFIKAAQKARRGILIDYVYEPPSQIVPQRLYRYDVFEDYVSRHRDDFEFGFDLISAIRTIPGTRSYGVYVVQLDHHSNYVYVGQTWYTPDERLAQHNTGLAVFHAAKPFKRGMRGTLRPDLYEHLPRVKSQAQSEALEAATALALRKAGFRVEGGH